MTQPPPARPSRRRPSPSPAAPTAPDTTTDHATRPQQVLIGSSSLLLFWVARLEKSCNLLSYLRRAVFPLEELFTFLYQFQKRGAPQSSELVSHAAEDAAPMLKSLLVLLSSLTPRASARRRDKSLPWDALWTDGGSRHWLEGEATCTLRTQLGVQLPDEARAALRQRRRGRGSDAHPTRAEAEVALNDTPSLVLLLPPQVRDRSGTGREEWEGGRERRQRERKSLPLMMMIPAKREDLWLTTLGNQG